MGLSIGEWPFAQWMVKGFPLAILMFPLLFKLCLKQSHTEFALMNLEAKKCINIKVVSLPEGPSMRSSSTIKVSLVYAISDK